MVCVDCCRSLLVFPRGSQGDPKIDVFLKAAAVTAEKPYGNFKFRFWLLHPDELIFSPGKARAFVLF